MNLAWILGGLAVLALVVWAMCSGGEPKGHDFDRDDEEDRRI